MHKNTVIIIAGPTAAGKTALAVRLAKALNTEIISADSRQCYQELNIGVAKPANAELAQVPHYFINSHSINDTVNAGVFEKYALAAADIIFQKHPVAVMVGGTGLYIKAFSDGIDEMPVTDPMVRQKIMQEYNEKGIAYLQEQLAAKDPVFWKIAEQHNPQRLMRALEIVLSTGRSITTFRTGNKQQRSFNIIKLGLELPREELYDRINKRVDLMIENGLVKEVEGLLDFEKNNALQTVGYRELFAYFHNKISLEKAVADIKTNTRHYAKRQMTWFKKDAEIKWFSPDSFPCKDFILK
ncbi:MAG TPA: tRNA (adenosine(37)-N6)-dimethylallyltransferase MiaA [Segetibacter sp.]